MSLRDSTRIDSSSSLDRQALRGLLSPSDTAIANYAGRELQPNRGVPLNLDWVNAVRVNTSALERRAQTIGTRRTVKKEWQARRRPLPPPPPHSITVHHPTPRPGIRPLLPCAVHPPDRAHPHTT